MKNNKSKKPITKFVLIPVLVILLVLFFLFNAFKTTVYDTGFYQGEHEKLGIYDKYGKNLVDSTTENLFSHLQEGTPLSGFFSERDKAHMVDVRELINSAFIFYYILIILIIICFLLLYLFDKKEFVKNISKSFIAAGFVTLSLALFAYILKGAFSSIFTGFHKLFFTNELWLLNPETDKLINIFPEQFFFDITALILYRALISAVVLVIIGVALYYLLKKR